MKLQNKINCIQRSCITTIILLTSPCKDFINLSIKQKCLDRSCKYFGKIIVWILLVSLMPLRLRPKGKDSYKGLKEAYSFYE